METVPAELSAQDWERTPPAVQARVLQLAAQVQQLQKTVSDLLERLKQDSTNSSRSPSTDRSRRKRRPPQLPSGKSPGGQPGHRRHERPLVPPEEVSEIIDVKPPECRACHRPLTGSDPQPHRHQVTELPPVTPQVTEFRLHQLPCTCGVSTRAELPAGVPRGAFGPRLQATLALWAGRYRIGKDGIQELAKDLYGVEISQGAISQLEQRTATALAAPVAELHEHVRGGPVNIDETGWWEKHVRTWLWAVRSATVVVFVIAARRSAKIAQQLLGEDFRWVATTDRCKAYDWLRRRQLCWAHLRRDFQAMIDRGGVGQAIGQRLLEHSDDLFRWWHRVRDGTLSRRSVITYVGWLRPSFHEVLEEGAACRCAKTAATCKDLLAKERYLWTFVRTEGVEPTNNVAEHQMRHPVQYRRASGGTRSARGSRFVERMLSVVGTCRLQGRNVLDYLTACCQAQLSGEPAPSLLPAEELAAAA